MKGFGIYVKNNLLDPKHVSAMGEQTGLWLYLWFLDHMTSISEEGIGLVLGGKPISYEQIGDELGMSRSGFTRWIARLKSYGYISSRRTPHGQVIMVHKAEKIFGNKYDASKAMHHSDESKVNSDESKLTHHSTDTDASNIRQYSNNTKDNTDNMIDRKKTLPTPKQMMENFLTAMEEKNEDYNILIRTIESKGISEQTAKKEIAKFHAYWTELNPLGTKQRWQMQKTFEVKRRLVTWFSNLRNYPMFVKEKKSITID